MRSKETIKGILTGDIVAMGYKAVGLETLSEQEIDLAANLILERDIDGNDFNEFQSDDIKRVLMSVMDCTLVKESDSGTTWIRIIDEISIDGARNHYKVKLGDQFIDLLFLDRE